ncbi:DUF4825 domain-containing protein [Bacillus sp. FJAT-22090]|uniref:DUF4825 domain-containing protein n=1 Tax=Bacillus sp. FJAT-22090 TaxID=1581038 RepID=UPI0011A98FC1|nr:DUF4825 domain-containing protein [Bacillus sp. FJAT-22090]
MQKTTWTIIGIALILLIGVFYVLNGNQKQVGQEDRNQLSVKTHHFKKVLAYESDYMGDASNINNLFSHLPFSNFKGTIELNSDDLLFTIHYDTESDEQVVIYNSTAAFVLIKNLEKVNMQFSDQSYIITRGNVEEWFGGDIAKLLDPTVFAEKVQKPLLENTPDEWINQYIK